MAKRLSIIMAIVVLGGGGIFWSIKYSPWFGGRLLSEEEVVKVLVEMHILNAVAETQPGEEESKKQFFMQQCLALCQQQGINPGVVQRSLQHYLRNPETMERIYEAVIDQLSLQRELAARS